jgi:DNA ligase (NAD+)
VKKEEAKRRIEKLKKIIGYHRYLYHVLNRQEISDSALDSLKHELYKLEQQFPKLITPDSPTQRIAGQPLEGFKKVKHKTPMLSIEDIFSEEELRDWIDYLKRLAPKARFNYFAELKIDGFAVTLIYENGIFTCGATRGNGKIGEDVTQNLKTIESIPLKLEIHPPTKFSGGVNKEIAETSSHLPPRSRSAIEERIKKLIERGEIEIRGEVYMEKKKFEKLNKKLEKKGQKSYANPRNLAAGSIRQLDPKLAASRPLDFLAYDIVTDLGQESHHQEHQILPILGFKVDKGKECQSPEEIIDFWKRSEKKREKYLFQIDGIVVNVNQNSLFEKLGVVGKSPRGVRAFKFSPKQATTEILDIKVQIGRTGIATPVAILKPVEVGGVKISRATLHNEDEIKRLGVKIGDTVIVGRAGDVIPDVIQALPELRAGKERTFKMPKRCPVCNTKLVREKGEVAWRCPNPKCPAREREYFYHFISKSAFDIVGLGPQIIDKLLEADLISDPADLFLLKEENLSTLEGFAEKSAKNLISAIESKKNITLPRFIYALGIRNVGEETAQDLAQHFTSFEKLKNASLKELQEIRDIGPVVAQSIFGFFREKRNLKLIKKLKKVGLEIIPEKKPRSQLLKGKTFVLTGALESITRKEAKEKIRGLGGDISESVSKKTDLVVVGSEPGSKLKEAKKLGIKIIKEKELLKLIK